MTLRELIELPEMGEEYREWLAHPFTKRLFECWNDQWPPVAIDPGEEKTELALYRHGQSIQANDILRTLKNLDEPLASAASVQASYDVVTTLTSQGWSETDAKRMAEDYLRDQEMEGRV